MSSGGSRSPKNVTASSCGCRAGSCGDVIRSPSNVSGPKTITLYCPTNESTTKESVEAVQNELNKYMESKYDTHVVLRFLHEEEYNDRIAEIYKGIHEEIAAQEAAEEAILEAKRLARQRGETYVESTTEAPETTSPFYIDEETGKIMTIYPEAGENQLDIFLVTDFPTFAEHILNEELAGLDDYLNNACKAIKSYVYPTFLTAAKNQGKTYGIPNTNIIGEYEYLFLNREMVDKYSYYPDDLNNIASLQDYLETLLRYEPEVIPFAGDITAPIETIAEDCYIGIFNSALATSGVKSTYKPTENAPKNLLIVNDYLNWLDKYHTLVEENAIQTEADATSAKIGAKIVKGDCTLSPTYAEVYGNYKVDEKSGLSYYTDENGVEYYVVVYKAPLADNASIFKSVFCVNAFSSNVEESMELLLEINTNPEIRNLLQFGVEGLTYEISETSGLVHILNDTYSMNPAYTGNILLLNQSEDWDSDLLYLSADNWQIVKNQNLESIASPLLGFYMNPKEIPEFNEDIAEDDPNYVLPISVTYAVCLEKAVEASAEANEKILAYTPEYDDKGELKVTYKNFLTGIGASFGMNRLTGWPVTGPFRP